MAELCKECFLKYFSTGKEDPDDIVETEWDDICECCYEMGPVVNYIKE